MIIDAVLLSWNRIDTLQQVINGIRKQSCIRNIYIWHNHPSKIKIEGAVNIYSEKNFKCRARHSFALNLDADYLLFIDDDVIMPDDYSKYILDGIKKYGDYAVLGPDGVLVDFKKGKETGLYYDWSGYPDVKKPVFVDIIKGKFHIIKREYIVYTFLYENKIDSPEEEKITSDDIFINLSIQCAVNKPSVVIPMPPLKNLDMGDGLTGREDHLKLRSDLVKRFIDYGWSSKVNVIQKIFPKSEIKLKSIIKNLLKR